MWTIDEARALIKLMQPLAWQMKYHIALGGGVLNKGRSQKDLDLYFLPMDDGAECDFEGLKRWLGGIWVVKRSLSDDENYKPSPYFSMKQEYATDEGKRIDVFVVGPNKKPEAQLHENPDDIPF